MPAGLVDVQEVTRLQRDGGQVVALPGQGPGAAVTGMTSEVTGQPGRLDPRDLWDGQGSMGSPGTKA